MTVKSDNKARDVERNLSHGFYTFRQEKKKKNTFREISIPEKRIRAMQEAIGLRISKISLSTAAIGGEAGYDHIQNAETHRHNQYMYSTDLKDAFPSVSAERIYTNLYSALEKIFAYSYSYLDKQQYETFVSTLIHFVTHKDKLPQ
ncbi:hypothetical protein KBC03_05095 [Patescibacteria group bacterium]|nr:hypothetical protein [Patescibacteria group bacterium]